MKDEQLEIINENDLQNSKKLMICDDCCKKLKSASP